MKEMIKEMIREELSKPKKTYYFMSGLPRAGSTLLSSILNQNPNVHSGPSSPVVSTMLMLEGHLSNDELFRAFPKNEQAAKIISSVMENYYSDVDKPVIIDKNRSWVNRMHYIPGYFDIEPKILCPVRNMDEILTSFLSMHRRNPFTVDGRINFLDEMLVKSNLPLNDENRCLMLSGNNGIVGQSYNGIRQAVMEGRQKQLHFIEYDDLLNNPEDTMRKIYQFLNLEYYNHDFAKIENIHKEKDAEVYGFPDMHDVRNSLNKVSAKPEEMLPESIYKQCQGTEFWRNLNDFVDTADINESNEDSNPMTENIFTDDSTSKLIGE